MGFQKKFVEVIKEYYIYIQNKEIKIPKIKNDTNIIKDNLSEKKYKVKEKDNSSKKKKNNNNNLNLKIQQVQNITLNYTNDKI